MSDPHIQTSMIITGKEYTEMQAEITRLKAEVDSKDAAKVLWERKAKEHLTTIEHLRAEVERLREFVLFVDKWTNYKPNKPHQPTSYENCVKTIAPMAAEFRAALTQEKTDV